MTDQMATVTKFGRYPLLADNARTAATAGVCAICGREYWPPQRICTLPGDRGTAHVGCVR